MSAPKCQISIKGKDKGRPKTGHEDPGKGGRRKQRYSSTLSLTSALHGGGWLTPRPGRFTPRKETRYPLCRSMGGPKSRLDGCGKFRFYRIRSRNRPARSESLYRLRYTSPCQTSII
jgi:hypothetical protein